MYQIHFRGLCTCARFMQDVRSSGKNPSTPLHHPTKFKFNVISSHRLAVPFCKVIFWGSVHVCTTMKISMHDASRSENIRSTSKYYHTKFHIIPSSIFAVFCLQILFGGLCTYARLCNSACRMQVDRKTFALLMHENQHAQCK